MHSAHCLLKLPASRSGRIQALLFGVFVRTMRRRHLTASFRLSHSANSTFSLIELRSSIHQLFHTLLFTSAERPPFFEAQYSRQSNGDAAQYSRPPGALNQRLSMVVFISAPQPQSVEPFPSCTSASRHQPASWWSTFSPTTGQHF